MTPSGPDPTWLLGLDVGGTKTAAVAGLSDGSVLERAEIASQPERGFEDMWGRVLGLTDGLTSRRGPPVAIGVSIGGPLDLQRELVCSPPNLPYWDDIPLTRLLRERYRVPSYMEHDARAGVLAEWRFGAARGRSHVVFLTAGTGLGAGVIVGDRLLRGATGRAGEVGHWRMAPEGPEAYGKTGSWEALSSGSGLPRLAAYLGAEEADGLADAVAILARARAGDAFASYVVDESATWLGRGVAYLVDLFNPQMVVLGSLAVRWGDLLLPVVRRVVEQECLPENAAACEIVAAGLGDRLGDIAALSVAIEGRRQPL
jgi:glucokinase